MIVFLSDGCIKNSVSVYWTEGLFFIRQDSSTLIFAVVTETIKIGDIIGKILKIVKKILSIQ